jgi:hypothetical protein
MWNASLDEKMDLQGFIWYYARPVLLAGIGGGIGLVFGLNWRGR